MVLMAPGTRAAQPYALQLLAGRHWLRHSNALACTRPAAGSVHPLQGAAPINAVAEAASNCQCSKRCVVSWHPAHQGSSGTSSGVGARGATQLCCVTAAALQCPAAVLSCFLMAPLDYHELLLLLRAIGGCVAAAGSAGCCAQGMCCCCCCCRVPLLWASAGLAVLHAVPGACLMPCVGLLAWLLRASARCAHLQA